MKIYHRRSRFPRGAATVSRHVIQDVALISTPLVIPLVHSLGRKRGWFVVSMTGTGLASADVLLLANEMDTVQNAFGLISQISLAEVLAGTGGVVMAKEIPLYTNYTVLCNSFSGTDALLNVWLVI